MKVALPIADEQLCAHFGHCERFYFYEVEIVCAYFSGSLRTGANTCDH